MALLCVLSFFQPTRQRFFISLAFCADCVVHTAIGDSLSDVNYYLCGGLFTLVALSFICLLSKPNRFADLMVATCFGSILLNIYGYFAYDYGLKADVYNNIFLVLYISTILIFLSRERGDNGDARHGRFLLPYRKRDNLCYPLYKKAQG